MTEFWKCSRTIKVERERMNASYKSIYFLLSDSHPSISVYTSMIFYIEMNMILKY